MVTILPIMILRFYSHAPRGARPAASFDNHLGGKFLLTRPSRGATVCRKVRIYFTIVSTHTPLAGRDRNGKKRESSRSQFLLTRPSRGATNASVRSAS